MKRILFYLSFWMLGSTAYAQGPAYFASHPTLSPDGKTIVFSFEGDLWQTDIQGNEARRLTALQGEEINPRISPDGKWLAFSSNQFGNQDVFVMPLAGGDIRQLTFHDANDEVDSWSWDSKRLYFTSGRYNRFTSYHIPLEGGTAQRVFPHYFNTIHQVAETPSGDLLFNNSWESYSAANRKRYKGAFNPDILSYNTNTGAYNQLTDYEGKDFWHTVDRQGNVYFVSDEANGEYNLYTLENGQKKGLTRFETSIKRPQVSANGEKIVFEKDYQLYVYDVASGESDPLSLNLFRNRVLVKEQEFDTKDNISAFDVSPDGKKIAFVSRGVVFVADISGKFVREVHSSPERAFEVKWLKDNKTLLASRTLQGYPNWVALAADGSGPARQITTDNRSNRDLTLNTARTHGVYLSGRDEVRLLDLNTLESKTLVKDEIWAFQNSSPSFSPDGEYVLFTAVRNFEQDIFVHHLKTGKTTNLTNTGVSETSPAWSADGKAIYFASNRTRPSYPFGLQDASIFRMELDNFDAPYRSEKFEELFQEDKKDSANAVQDVISINTQDIRDRITRISPAFGTQTRVLTLRKGNKDYVFFHSNHEGGRSAVYRTIIQDFEDNKTEKVADGFISGITVAGSNYYVLSRGTVQKYNMDTNKLEPINISQKFNRNLNDEFQQMYYETWAGIEENFYESGFHGLDWAKTRDQYARFLPYINNRNDLRVLLNDMLGELNSSHLGFNSSGREEQRNLRYVTNETGIVFAANNPYRVERIVNNSPASKLGRDIQAGDVLVAVDGQTVDPKIDRDYYFTKPSLAAELRLSFDRNGTIIHTTVRPQRSNSLRDGFYGEWIKNNRSRVDSLSGNRIAYSHMKNMSGGELETFLLDMVEQENNKEAIILDLRYNTGGNVHDEVLKFLSQRPYLQWQYRGGKRSPQSNFAPAGKPIVLLINQQSLSDAEMTAAGFKALNLGTIIGTETYRWIIFTSSKGLVDGSSYRVPGWGVYTLDGDNLELTGVKPDIHVENTFLDLIHDRDPQLERAVQEILKQL
ncbi:MAG TPA: LpqB family beta-propeller domain-containing protein [Sphingobacteriaceae bacterium]|nr:LpqB family beta-propeller domain-containing protein [Sphingobacteriaceae bacterium]